MHILRKKALIIGVLIGTIGSCFLLVSADWDGPIQHRPGCPFYRQQQEQRQRQLRWELEQLELQLQEERLNQQFSIQQRAQQMPMDQPGMHLDHHHHQQRQQMAAPPSPQQQLQLNNNLRQRDSMPTGWPAGNAANLVVAPAKAGGTQGSDPNEQWKLIQNLERLNALLGSLAGQHKATTAAPARRARPPPPPSVPIPATRRPQARRTTIPMTRKSARPPPPATTPQPVSQVPALMHDADAFFAEDEVKPSAPVESIIRNETNRVFLDCCRAKRVPVGCESRCNYDVLDKKILTAMFMGRDKCPMEFGYDLFTCAAQDSDHTACCRQNGVHLTSAGNKCLTFCDLSPGATQISADANYLPCLGVLEKIKACFREKIMPTQIST